MTGTIVSVVKVKSESEVEAVDISSRLGDTENVRFSSMAQTKNKSEESVQVVVRCRPLNEKEIEQGWISADLLMKHIHWHLCGVQLGYLSLLLTHKSAQSTDMNRATTNA